MKAKIATDKFRRLALASQETLRNSLLYVTHNESIPAKVRLACQLQLNELPRPAAFTYLRPRCVLTGRSRSLNYEFGIGRHEFRKLGLAGLLPGVTKSSW